MLRLIASWFSQPKSTRYKIAGQLRGYKDYVYALAMTRDGGFLASGGIVFHVLEIYRILTSDA